MSWSCNYHSPVMLCVLSLKRYEQQPTGATLIITPAIITSFEGGVQTDYPTLCYSALASFLRLYTYGIQYQNANRRHIFHLMARTINRRLSHTELDSVQWNLL